MRYYRFFCMGSCPKVFLNEENLMPHQSRIKGAHLRGSMALHIRDEAAPSDHLDETRMEMTRTSYMEKRCFRAVAQMCNGMPRPADNMEKSVMGMFWAAAIAAAISCVFLGGGYRRHPWLDPLLPYLQQQLTGESVARLNPAGAGSNAVDGGGMEWK